MQCLFHYLRMWFRFHHIRVLYFNCHSVGCRNAPFMHQFWSGQRSPDSPIGSYPSMLRYWNLLLVAVSFYRISELFKLFVLTHFIFFVSLFTNASCLPLQLPVSIPRRMGDLVLQPIIFHSPKESIGLRSFGDVSSRRLHFPTVAQKILYLSDCVKVAKHIFEIVAEQLSSA